MATAEHLDDALNGLFETYGRLRDRLHPLLVPTPMKDELSPSTATNSSRLVDSLTQSVQRAHYLTDLLQQLEAQIQL
jgi:hypothetical protein